MCNEEKLRAILKALVEVYRGVYGSALVSAYLYGSYARGENDAFSDIDVVAIVKGERVQLQTALRKVWDVSSELELEHETIVSPTVIPYDEFEAYKEVLPCYRNIETEGVKLLACF